MTVMGKVAAVAAAGAAALVVSAGVAQASTTDSGTILYTGTLADCQEGGNNGVAGNVFDSYYCESSWGGTYTLRVYPTVVGFSGVYLHTFPTSVGCETAAAAGEPGIWTSYECKDGFAGYALIVSG
ncbi:hypothetical protein [Actinokineospora inagensis]|uniref:hypothetical protein n=1 Tax=Actinokineospora inagensis TaxID=103730 RepID=UPI0003FFB9A7|nr:hypothetical protein [Actinokineospora inagensis]